MTHWIKLVKSYKTSVISSKVPVSIDILVTKSMFPDMPNELLRRKVERKEFVDSRTLFTIVSVNSTTVEHSSKIDIFVFKKKSQSGELMHTRWYYE